MTDWVAKDERGEIRGKGTTPEAAKRSAVAQAARGRDPETADNYRRLWSSLERAGWIVAPRV